MLAQPVHFVVDGQDGFISDTQFLEHLIDGFRLLPGQFMGAVHHVEQQVRILHHFQGGFEGRHQLMGQPLDEPYGVRQGAAAAVRQIQLPGGGVQGGEQLILGIDVRMGQGIQQGALPGVGIPHQAHLLHFVLVPGPLLLFPVALHPADLVFQEGDPIPDPPPVHFQLGFPGSPGTDAAPQTGETGALAHDPGQHVLELGQFHL